MIAEWLEARLCEGGFEIGQVRVDPGIVVRHAGDTAATEIFTRPEDAREIAKYDDTGRYRPLKTAPNLRHGWELRLRDAGELRLALDFLYPAAVGTWLAHERGELAAVSLRETLERQTGMYRVARRITDGQASEAIEKTCVAGCIRHRLWGISAIQNPQPAIQNSSVLCAEPCNLLVAACRTAVRPGRFPS